MYLTGLAHLVQVKYHGAADPLAVSGAASSPVATVGSTDSTPTDERLESMGLSTRTEGAAV